MCKSAQRPRDRRAYSAAILFESRPGMPAVSVALKGDVVVRHAEVGGAPAYVLRVVPGPDQYFLRTRERAVAHAVAFSTLAGVRAWWAAGDADLRPLTTDDVPAVTRDACVAAGNAATRSAARPA